MKNDLLKRVERMEQRVACGEEHEAWFVNVVSPGAIGKPVIGWSFGTETEQVEVLRQEGENDEDLMQRAVALAREHLGKGSSPILISLTDQAPTK